MTTAREDALGGLQSLASKRRLKVAVVVDRVGAFMPPVGIGFYVACSVAGSRVEVAARAMLPLLIVLIAAVVAIAFVPAITLAVPRLLGSAL